MSEAGMRGRRRGDNERRIMKERYLDHVTRSKHDGRIIFISMDGESFSSLYDGAAYLMGNGFTEAEAVDYILLLPQGRNGIEV
jgi:hypothetical protein